MENRISTPTTAQWLDTNLAGIQYPDEETLNRHKEIISGFCNRLVNTIQQQRPIQDRELFDFSKIVIWIIGDSMTSLPGELNGLTGQISDYWHFEANTDTNSKRKYSYIRLYQMAILLQNYAHEQEQIQKVHVALRENMLRMETISSLYRFPGITCRKLQEMLDLSSEELQAQLDPLKKGGFLKSRRSGEEQYYMLANDGEVLYRQMRKQERRMRTAGERRELFDDILQILLEYKMKSYQILFILEYLQNCGNTELTQFLRLLRQYLYKISAPAKIKPYEVAYQWMSALSVKDNMLLQQNFTHSWPYQSKVIKKNLLALKYQNLYIGLNKIADSE